MNNLMYAVAHEHKMCKGEVIIALHIEHEHKKRRSEFGRILSNNFSVTQAKDALDLGFYCISTLHSLYCSCHSHLGSQLVHGIHSMDKIPGSSLCPSCFYPPLVYC